MTLWRYQIISVVLFFMIFSGFYLLKIHPGGTRSSVMDTVAWQRMASPGALSQAHTFLEHDCAACHTSVEGVTASSCIVCHANNTNLLQRQPTAFHATVTSCKECHREHQGLGTRPTMMRHEEFAGICLRQLENNPRPESEAYQFSRLIRRWVSQPNRPSSSEAPSSSLTPAESVLNCAACHANNDRHLGFFGANCASCHGSVAWTIPEFRHPAATSQSCAQCHQAPPSHYMMHFKMISMSIARMVKAEVNQCFLCHQTTVWNDIKGVGFYKHH